MRQVLLALITIIVVASLAAVGTYAGFIDTETSEGNFVEAGTLDLFLENPTGVGDSLGHGVLRTWHYENLTSGNLMEPGNVLSSYVKLKAFSTGEGDHVDIHCVNVNSEPVSDIDAENVAENEILITHGGGIDDDADGLIDEDDIDGTDNDGDGLIDEDPNSATGPVPTTPNRGVYDKDRVMIITSMTYHTTTIIAGSYINPVFFVLPDDDLDGDGRISLYEFQVKGLHGLTPVPDSEGEITFFMTIEFAEMMKRGDAWVSVGNEYQGDATNMTLIFALMQ